MFVCYVSINPAADTDYLYILEQIFIAGKYPMFHAILQLMAQRDALASIYATHVAKTSTLHHIALHQENNELNRRGSRLPKALNIDYSQTRLSLCTAWTVSRGFIDM